MKALKVILQLFLLIHCTSWSSYGQDESVEVVIATGLEMSQASAMSPDNKFVAQALYNVVSIWDVKTGRLLRKVAYVDNLGQTTDTLWFSPDSKKVIVGLMLSNDAYHIDIETGEKELVKGPAFDYSNYTYNYSIRTSSTLHLYSGSKDELVYPSPDKKKKIVFKIIENPLGNSNVVKYAFETHLKIKGRLTPPLDTVFQASFAFSEDSRYVFAESAIYDLTSGRRISYLKMVPFSGNSIMFLPNSRTPVTAALGAVRVWDFPGIEEIKIKHMSQFGASADRRYLICATFDWDSGKRSYVKVDLVKKKVIGKPVRTEQTGYLLDVSDDGDFYTFLEMIKEDVSSAEIKYQVKLCQGSTGKVIKTIPNTLKGFFTQEEGVMLIDSAGVKNMKYNVKTGVSTPFFPGDNTVPQYAHLVSSNHKYIFGSEALRTEEDVHISNAIVYDIQSEQEVFKVETKGISLSAFNVSKDESKVAFASSKGHVIYVYDFKSGELLNTLKGHTAIVEKTVFSDDGTRLLSACLDGTRRIWNLEKNHEMASLINVGKNDYAIVTPQQYYYATKGAKKLIHFVKGVDIYPFAQFDLKYNRPDIIIQSLEASNQGLIKPYYYAYQKRLKRLGFTEEMLDGTFHMPTASIDNASEIPVSTKLDSLTIKYSANDIKFNLDRVIIRVNEVPLQGKRGISLKNKESKSFQDELNLALSVGKNTIEVSVMNEKGVESIASNVTVYYEPSKRIKPNLYLYTIGVSKYKQSEFDLTYAAKDANDVVNLFSGDVIPFKKVISKEFTNEQVTLETIKEIKKDLNRSKVDDAVCIFFAGHGVLDVKLDYYLASYDIDFQNPADRGIPYEVFEDLLDNVPARKKLIMIDACHSGEIDKEEVVLAENVSTTENQDITFRSVNSTTVKQVGLNNSYELMRELFTDLRKSSGAVIISSAGGMEYAMEGGQWNNGVFTYCFLRGIQDLKADLNEDGTIMLSEMNAYIREEVFKLTNGKQHPTNRAEVFESDWRIW